MNIHIEPSKLEKLILYILKSLDRSVGSVELAKLIYLIDIESFRLTGATITNQKYYRAPLGPIVSDFEVARSWLDGFEINVSEEQTPSPRGTKKHSITLGPKPRFSSDFSSVEEAIISKALSRYSKKSVSELKRIAYDTEPWKIIQDYETTNKKYFRGELDLSSLKRNLIYSDWLSKKDSAIKKDKEYEEFLSNERNEVKELLSSLST